ncbi:MAG: signal peptide peptidase SppA [Chitinophagaceae bacterium]
MRQFFKIFFASLLAFIVFVVIGIFIMAAWVAGVASSLSSDKPTVGSKAVLYLDLSQAIAEQGKDNPLSGLSNNDEYDSPGLYDMVKLLQYAKTDTSVKGIYIKCADNANGFATSDELRAAIIDFKTSNKFVYAYADVISQRAYLVANAANKIYCNPKGGLEWKGFVLQYMFFKQTLDKLGIEPQIFYAGKFKSATEPFRTDRMTDANKLQSSVFLNDLYNRFLIETSEARHVDTASLHQYAATMAIQTAEDAVKYKLIDDVMYDDEVKQEIKQRMGLTDKDKINFIEAGKYAKAVNYKSNSGENRIALIFAQGDIVDGKGEKGQIGGDTYRSLIRTARMDDKVKAIVIRVNSGGGSAMASENMWREISLARKQKPVVLSFGDYAASGGYYMSCGADSIFTSANTLTGSIGVFSIVPNLQKFFNDKIGITFDGVKTSEYADMPTASRPLNDAEKRFLQNDVDSIYHTFLGRVSEGRKINIALVDSIGQGRVWTGTKGLGLGLVDKIGSLQDAINCAARMGKLGNAYRIKEYPEPLSWWESLMGGYKKSMQAKAMQEELGDEGMTIYSNLKKIKQSVGSAQARLPFVMDIR